MNLTTDPFIFNIYKPRDITSYDAIRVLKRTTLKGIKKIGHFGTLDPFAEGLLLIGINSATRLNNYIHDGLSKTYIAHGILGKESNTGDVTGEIIKLDESKDLEEKFSKMDIASIEKELTAKFIGDYWQAPHAFSAAKFEGKKLYEYARQGIEIKKEKKLKKVYSLKVLEYNFPELIIEFKVSSGTYIRTLFSECANHLGSLGYLDKLIRTQIGSVFSNTMDLDNHSLSEINVDLEQLLPFQSVSLDESMMNKMIHGNPITLNEIPDEESPVSERFCGIVPEIEKMYWVKDENAQIRSLGGLSNDQLRPVINF